MTQYSRLRIVLRSNFSVFPYQQEKPSKHEVQKIRFLEDATSQDNCHDRESVCETSEFHGWLHCINSARLVLVCIGKGCKLRPSGRFHSSDNEDN